MNMNIDNFKEELSKYGLFKMIKLAAMTIICGAIHIRNEATIEHGAKHGKITLCLGNNVLWIAPDDIECFWSDKFRAENERTPSDHYFIRTKSGREFEVSESSWYKVMHGNDFKEERQ